MQKYDNLGEVFKTLRTNRHYSLKQISNDEVSASQISRFERGESDLSVSKFFIALDNMKVEPDDFMSVVNNYEKSDNIKFMSSLIKLEYERDIEGFHKLQLEEEQKFRAHPDQYRYHLNTILLQSFICKCDSGIAFPQSYIDEITDYLFTTENWDMYELILIGNLYLFLDIPLLHRMGQEIVNRKEFYSEIGTHKNLVSITLLNIWETCLHRDSLEIADYYRQKSLIFIKDETKLYERTIHLFLSGLQHYKAGMEHEGIEEMNRAIQLLDWLGCKNLANNYRKDFEKFVK